MIKVEIIKNIDMTKVNLALKKGIINGVYTATNIVHAQAVETSPIKKGALRNSISQKVNEDKVYGEVFIPANGPAGKYGYVLELSNPPYHAKQTGTRIPFLRPALYENADKCQKAFQFEVDKTL